MPQNRINNFIKIGGLILVISFLLLVLDIVNLPTKLGFNIRAPLKTSQKTYKMR
jgi:hypothetical protein